MTEYTNGQRVEFWKSPTMGWVRGIYIGPTPDGRLVVISDGASHVARAYSPSFIRPAKRTPEEIALDIAQMLARGSGCIGIEGIDDGDCPDDTSCDDCHAAYGYAFIAAAISEAVGE